jgi:hypothetical protein
MGMIVYEKKQINRNAVRKVLKSHDAVSNTRARCNKLAL